MNTARILVIEDESAVREVLREGLTQVGHEVLVARDGVEGLQVFERKRPHIVLADVQMPGMEGIEVLHKIKAVDPAARVVIMTGYGSEETAIEALRGGAINYLKKPVILRELYRIVDKAMGLQTQHMSGEFVLEESKRIVIKNAIDKIWGVVNQLLINSENVCTRARIQEIGLGLYEMILNAIEHGNLGITFEEKCRAIKQNTYEELLKERLSDPAYAARRVTIECRMTQRQLDFAIKDEGEGFNWRDPSCPDWPGDLLNPCGRGILLARMYLDRVEFNEKGNEVYLVKYGDLRRNS